MACGNGNCSCSGPNCRQEGGVPGFGGGGDAGNEHPPLICPPLSGGTPGSEEAQCAHLTDYAGSATCLTCDCPVETKICKIEIWAGKVGTKAPLSAFCHMWIVVTRCDGSVDRYDQWEANIDVDQLKSGTRKLGKHLYANLKPPYDWINTEKWQECEIEYNCPCPNEDGVMPDPPCCERITDAMVGKYKDKDNYGGNDPSNDYSSYWNQAVIGVSALKGPNSNTFVKKLMDVCEVPNGPGETCSLEICAWGANDNNSYDFFGDPVPGEWIIVPALPMPMGPPGGAVFVPKKKPKK